MITAEMHNNSAKVGLLHYQDGNTQRHRNNHHRQIDRHAYEIYEQTRSHSAYNSDVTRGTGSGEYFHRSSMTNESGTGCSASPTSLSRSSQQHQQQRTGATSGSSPDSVSSSEATHSSRNGPKILFNLLSLGGSSGGGRDHREEDMASYDVRGRDDCRLLIDDYVDDVEEETMETMNVEFATENTLMTNNNNGGRPKHGTHSAPSAIGSQSSASGGYFNTVDQRHARGDVSTSGSTGVVGTSVGGGEFLVPTYCRPRSKSMGTNGWRPLDYPPSASAGGPSWWNPMHGGGYAIRTGNSGFSRTPSRDSLVSFDESVASSDDCGSVALGPAMAQSSATMGPSGSVRYQVGVHTGPTHVRKSHAVTAGSVDSREDALLEDTRSRLMTLRTSDRPPETVNCSRECCSHSQPGSPPSLSPVFGSHTSSAAGYPDGVSRSQQQYHRHIGSHNYYYQQQPQPTVRKYSEGSQLMRTHLHGRWRNRASSIAGAIGVSHSSPSSATSTISGSGESPVDLSCKKKKFDAGLATSAGLPYARRPSMSSVPGTGTGNSNFSNSSSSRYVGITPSLQDFQPSFATSSDKLNSSVDEGIENTGDCDDASSDTSSSSSILRSILLQTGRGRSYSMSVCMTSASVQPTVVRGRDTELYSSNGRPLWQKPMRKDGTSTMPLPEHPPPASHQLHRVQPPQSGALSTPVPVVVHQQQHQQRHQKVVLAKKNQLPVLARVADHLGKIVELVRVVPRFGELPMADRKTLLTNACGRLLLLYMAESNTQFAVTAINGGNGVGTGGSSWSSSPSGGTPPLTDETQSFQTFLEPRRSMSFSSGSWSGAPVRVGSVAREVEVPTQQFVDGVQNFIRKCQSFGLGPEEYFHMRVIALFQSGAGTTLERAELVDQVNTDARQRLQDLIHRTNNVEKLRYSNVLLLLHTLFGIHCGMLQSLFFRPTANAAGFDEFVWNALKAAESASEISFDAVSVSSDMVS